MPFDILGYYNTYKDRYPNATLDDIAKDVFVGGEYDKEFSDFNEWKKAAGIDSIINEDIERRKPFEQKLREGVSNVSPFGLVKSLGTGLAEGLTTQLPAMAGEAIEFAGSFLPGQTVEETGKSLKEWAQNKKEEWYGPDIERTGLDRIVYEGSKMLAPSIVPGGIVRTILTGAKGLSNLSKLKIASGATASLFALSQAQSTRDNALQQAKELEAQGNYTEAKKIRESIHGFAPIATGIIEGTGEYFGTKYLGKLFGLGEVEAAKRGAGQLMKDLLKTIGVEVGTEIGQQAGQAMVEKHYGIRPEADAVAEAIDVIGPTTFMTLLTFGLASAANARKKKSPEEEEANRYIENLKQGAMASMAIHEGMKTGKYEGKPFTKKDALEIMTTGQKSGIFTTEDIDRFRERYPILRTEINDMVVDSLKDKITQVVNKITPAQKVETDVPISLGERELEEEEVTPTKEHLTVEKEEHKPEYEAVAPTFNENTSAFEYNEAWGNLVQAVEDKKAEVTSRINALQEEKKALPNRHPRKKEIDEEIKGLKKSVEDEEEKAQAIFGIAADKYAANVIAKAREEGITLEEDEISETIQQLMDGRTHDVGGGETWTQPVLSQIIDELHARQEGMQEDKETKVKEEQSRKAEAKRKEDEGDYKKSRTAEEFASENNISKVNVVEKGQSFPNGEVKLGTKFEDAKFIVRQTQPEYATQEGVGAKIGGYEIITNDGNRIYTDAVKKGGNVLISQLAVAKKNTGVGTRFVNFLKESVSDNGKVDAMKVFSKDSKTFWEKQGFKKSDDVGTYTWNKAQEGKAKQTAPKTEKTEAALIAEATKHDNVDDFIANAPDGYVRIFHDKAGVGAGGQVEKGKFFVSNISEPLLKESENVYYLDLPIEEAKNVLGVDLETAHFMDNPKATGWETFKGDNTTSGAATLPDKYYAQLKPKSKLIEFWNKLKEERALIAEARKYKTAEELFNSKDNNAKGNFIKLFYEANGLKVDKIVRAKLNDGFYVYHQYGFENRAYKPAKIIEEGENYKVKQTQPYKIKSDFIDDSSTDSLQFTVMEGRHRAGLSGNLDIRLTDIWNKAQEGKTKEPLEGEKPKAESNKKADARKQREIKKLEESIPKIEKLLAKSTHKNNNTYKKTSARLETDRKRLAELKGEPLKETTIIEPTKADDKNVTTFKEQKVYIVDKAESLLQDARKRFRKDHELPEEYDVDTKGSYQIPSNYPVIDDGSEKIVVEVPNDGQYKINNQYQAFSTFYKNAKAIRTSEDLTKKRRALPKPTGKPISQIEKEALDDYMTAYDRYRKHGNLKMANELKESIKEDYPVEYKKIVKQEEDERKELISFYKQYSDTTEEEATVAKWEKIISDIDNKKITLKSLSNEFPMDKAPSYREVKEKLEGAKSRLNDLIKHTDSTKEKIKLLYPDTYKEMFENIEEQSLREQGEGAIIKEGEDVYEWVKRQPEFANVDIAEIRKSVPDVSGERSRRVFDILERKGHITPENRPAFEKHYQDWLQVKEEHDTNAKAEGNFAEFPTKPGLKTATSHINKEPWDKEVKDWSDFQPNKQGYQARELEGLKPGYFIAQQSLDEFHIIEAARGTTRAMVVKRGDTWKLKTEVPEIGKDYIQFKLTDKTFDTPQNAALEFNRYMDIITTPENYRLDEYKEYGREQTHKNSVINAVQRGENPPGLKDYPGLIKAPEKAEEEIPQSVTATTGLKPKTQEGGSDKPGITGLDINRDMSIHKPLSEQKKQTSNEPVNTSDSGEELVANKRNRIRTGIKWADIEDKNTALKIKETTKQNVYPKPDYQQMIDDGVEPIIAHIVKQVYDVIPTKPPLPKSLSTDEALQLYINAVNRVMEGTIKWTNDKNAIAVWAEKQARYAGATLGKTINLTDLTSTEKSNGLLDFVYPEGYKNYRPEIMLLGGNKLLRMLQPGYEQGKKALKEIKAGWPTPQESWQRQGYSIIGKNEIKISEGYRDANNNPVYYLMINNRGTGKQYNTKEDIQKAIDSLKPFILIDKYRRPIGQYDTLEQAQEAAREKVKRENKPTISEKGISVEQAERIGVARRKEGENITSDQLRNTFGFKGVNFGNWMKGKSKEAERQLHLNHAYDSFMDLAEILNVPPAAISLNGFLGVAFGAQGTGKYAAHFVPGVNEINLTRTSGAGSLAHEWGHALDHYFANQAGLQAERKPFLTEHATSSATRTRYEKQDDGSWKKVTRNTFSDNIRPEIIDLFKKTVRAMNQKTIMVTPEEQVRQAGARKEDSKRRINSWLKSIKEDFVRHDVTEADFDKLAERIRNLDLGDGMVAVSSEFSMSPVVSELRNLYKEKTGRVYSLDQIKGLQSNIDYYKYLSEEEKAAHTPQSEAVSTDFAKAASKLDKGKKAYWNTEVEKFARSFDAFISDTLEEKAAKNTYLSHIGRADETVPHGEERAAINQAFKNLINEIKTRETDKGVEMYSVRGMYSQLEKVVTEKLSEMPSKVQSIPNWLERQNVKPAEMKWMGVEQWLKENQKDGRIDKQAFADFIRANQIEIKEVMKGDVIYTTRDDLPHDITPTKFSSPQWQLPGGENYRELLLTLPIEKVSGATQDIIDKAADDIKEALARANELTEEASDVIDKWWNNPTEENSRAVYEVTGEDTDIYTKSDHVLANVKNQYQSPHWDEPNVLAHVRMNDRTDAEGNKVLFVEEVQSDWHQEGEKKGYKTTLTKEKAKQSGYSVYKTKSNLGKDAYFLEGPDTDRRLTNFGFDTEEAAWNELLRHLEGRSDTVPNAPFAKNWHELVMKRMLRYAAENGYDKIAWTTGKTQIDRYEEALRQNVDEIHYEPAGEGLWEISAYKNGKSTFSEDEVNVERLQELVGKNVSAKIITDQGSLIPDQPYRDWRVIKGEDLSIGGEGMKSFYDNLIPGFMNRYVKQWGAKVGTSEINVGVGSEETVPSVTITPAMKESVMQGQPMYSTKDIDKQRYQEYNNKEGDQNEQRQAADNMREGRRRNDLESAIPKEHARQVGIARQGILGRDDSPPRLRKAIQKGQGLIHYPEGYSMPEYHEVLAVAQEFGVDVIPVRDTSGQTNGFLKDGIVFLNMEKGDMTLMQVAMHEISHHLGNQETQNKIDRLSQAFRQYRMSLSRAYGRTLSEAHVLEEYAADIEAGVTNAYGVKLADGLKKGQKVIFLKEKMKNQATQGENEPRGPPLKDGADSDNKYSMTKDKGTGNIPAKTTPQAEAWRDTSKWDYELFKEARKYNDAEDFLDSRQYFRNSDSKTGERDVNWQLFTQDRERAQKYGKYEFFTDDKDAVDGYDLIDDVAEFLEKKHPEILKEYGVTNPYKLANEIYPDDIVDSAGIWDNPELVDILWDEFLEPRGIKKIKTADGMIVLDDFDKHIKTKKQLIDIYNKAHEHPNPSRPPEAGGQYSIRTPQNPPASSDPKVLNLYLKDETDAIVQTIMNKLHPKSMTWLETMLKSPEWFDHPQINNIVRLFIRDRNELRHETFNDLNAVDDINATGKTVTEAGLALKNKGLSRAKRITGEVSPEYQLLQDFIDYFDTSWKRNKNKTDEQNLKDCENYMRKHGGTDDVIRVWKLYRKSYDRALEIQIKQMNELIEKLKEEAAFKGEEANIAELQRTLKYALAEMKEWRGYYAPRLREMGDWKVQAYKEHGPLPQNREYYREHRGSELSAQRLAKKLEREGWKVYSVDRVERLPESIYQDVRSVATAKLIDEALTKMTGSLQSDKLVLFNEELLRSVADEIRARGFRSTMISRREGAVIKGYIEDPIKRHLLYINNLAGGVAKSRVARMAMEELLGQVIEGKRTGGINPVKDPEAYKVATNYIEEQLRNLEASDRVIGLAKSIATFKFLGFNIRSLVVNMTALATTAPTSIHQYALGGKGSMIGILKTLGIAGKDYGAYMAGKKLNAEEQAFLEEIEQKGWNDPQYTRDALGIIAKTHSRVWSTMMDGSMYLFGQSEKFNRGTTILAAYRLARKQGRTMEEARELAKEASDKAHGVYGRETLPMWAQGVNPAAKIGQMLYVYMKFAHNYLQMLHDVGLKKHNIKGALFAFLSPVVVAGGAALPFKDVIFALFGAILSLLGWEKDPEKWVWDQIREHLGTGAEKVGRHGLTGAAGVDISGSLSIGVGVPKSMMDFTGAIGGAIESTVEAGAALQRKEFSKAAEAFLPTGIANPIRAYREAQEGVTTRRNYPVFDETGRQLRPTPLETVEKTLGFRSSRQATLSERTWEAKRQVAKYNEKRNELYQRYRSVMSSRDRKKYAELVKDVREYNRQVRDNGLEAQVPLITSESLRRQSIRMQKPTTRQAALLQ